jgi:hypothetical protein
MGLTSIIQKTIPLQLFTAKNLERKNLNKNSNGNG